MFQQRKQRAVHLRRSWPAASSSRRSRLRSRSAAQSIAERTLTLFAQDPVSLYSASRGGQLVYTFDDLLHSYPLGAGLGRWGMIGGYFGGGSERAALGRDPGGGLGHRRRHPARSHQRRGARRRAPGRAAARALPIRMPKVRACAGIVLAANLGTAALIFSFTPFVTQIGLQFWFLAGAVHGDRHARGRARRRPMSTWLLVSGDFTALRRDGHGQLRARELPRARRRREDRRPSRQPSRLAGARRAAGRARAHRRRGRSACTASASRCCARRRGGCSSSLAVAAIFARVGQRRQRRSRRSQLGALRARGVRAAGRRLAQPPARRVESQALRRRGAPGARTRAPRHLQQQAHRRRRREAGRRRARSDAGRLLRHRSGEVRPESTPPSASASRRALGLPPDRRLALVRRRARRSAQGFRHGVRRVARAVRPRRTGTSIWSSPAPAPS